MVWKKSSFSALIRKESFCSKKSSLPKEKLEVYFKIIKTKQVKLKRSRQKTYEHYGCRKLVARVLDLALYSTYIHTTRSQRNVTCPISSET